MRTGKRSLILWVCCIVSFSACLKTRAQMKHEPEESENSRPVSVAPQDVQPQGQSSSSDPGGSAPGGYALDEMREEVTRMEGRLQELERKEEHKDAAAKSSLAESPNLKEDLKQLNTRLTQLEQTQATLLESVKKLEQTPVTVKDPIELYKKAKAQYEQGDFEQAAATFGAYLEAKPKGSQKTVEDATFLRGESLYKLKQYKKAIIEYSKFPEHYPKSNHMSDALYKIGLSFEALGMKEDATGFFQELVEKYPKSIEAKKARKKIK